MREAVHYGRNFYAWKILSHRNLDELTRDQEVAK